MKFTVDELLRAGSHKWERSTVDDVTLRNLDDLCLKLNALGYEPAMFASSCLRSLQDQKRINPKATKSCHLFGAAVDIKDPDGKFAAWCLAHKSKLTSLGLWMEDPRYTVGWVHLQIFAPKSFNRVYLP